MKTRVFTLLLAGVSVLVLMIATASVGLAITKYQPGLSALAKTSACANAACTDITNTVTFTTTLDGTVVIQDNFLHGVNLVGGLTLTALGIPVLPAPTATLTGSSPDRKTYDFSLGTLAAGSYVLSFMSHVDTTFPKNNLYTKNAINFYLNGAWKGKAQSITPSPTNPIVTST